MPHRERVETDVATAETYEDLKPYTAKLNSALESSQRVLGHLSKFAMKGDFERFLADATIFMEMMSTVVIAWQWIKMAASAKQALVTGSMTQTESFYNGQIHTMKFYFKYELPKISGHAETLLSDEVLTIVNEEEAVEAFS